MDKIEALDSKKEREQKELDALMARYCPSDHEEVVERLCERAAALKVIVEDLEEIIRREGPVVTNINGNGFSVNREHPAAKLLNTTMKSYCSVLRQLTSIVPERSESDYLTRWINAETEEERNAVAEEMDREREAEERFFK